jgi:hypothetical protein
MLVADDGREAGDEAGVWRHEWNVGRRRHGPFVGNEMRAARIMG